MTSVVVTGLGLVTPIGIGAKEVWASLMEGTSGAGPIESFDASELPVRFACEVTDFDPSHFMPAKEAFRTDRFAQMALAAASLAWEQASCLEFPCAAERIGVIVGSGIGGLGTIESEHKALLSGGPRRVSPFMIPKLMPNAAAGAIAMEFGFNGPNYAVSSACATGAHAIGDAYRNIKAGVADVIIAGGTESACTPLAMAAFARMGALSTRNDSPATASRPFERDRDGFVMGEGAGILVLENKDVALRRGADILAEVTGYGASADAHHVTQPDPEGKGARLAMQAALTEAGVRPEQLDYINAHGTSTPFNDRIETAAIKDVLGPESKRIPVSSTKSQTGHLLGAAGAVEAAISVMAIRESVVPSTRNLEVADPDCDLDYVSQGPREGTVRSVLSNSFGFGGQNCSLVFEAV